MTGSNQDVAAPASASHFACRDLQAGYGDVRVVRGFDLEVEAGTVVAVLGPNGAGKTTLLATMAGLLSAQGGTVTVAGEQLRPGRPSQASTAGVVLVTDDRALFGSLSVEENIRAAARGKASEALDSAFTRFPALTKRRKVHAVNLSGGEQQMLAIARALVQKPRVLLIDEMSMGLAPVIVEELLPMVRSIADETGAVVVLVEQHVSLALEVADRAMVLVHGETVLDDTSAQLRAKPDLLEAAYLGTQHT